MTLPITDYIGPDGEELEVDDRHKASAVVAGPDGNGQWWSIAVKDTKSTMH